MSTNRYRGVDSYAAFFIDYKIRKLIQLPMFTPDDYEDLEQELMLAYLLAMPKFNPENGDKKPFIKAVINNKVSDLLSEVEANKRWSGAALLSLDAPMNEDSSLSDLLESGQHLWRNPFHLDSQASWEDEADFEVTLSLLSEDQQQLCRLLLEHSAAEIAKILQIPEQTIYSRIKALRKKLEKKK